MERVDVAIIGGGPAGSSAAHAAASAGADAVVLEKGVPRDDREEVGPDSTDAAGILDYWVDIMGIHPDEFSDDVVECELERAEFAGPTQKATLYDTGIESSYDKFGYTFHRARFDDWLRRRAEDAGAEYRVGTRVTGVNTRLDADPRHRIAVAGDDADAVGADFVVLADGPQRTVTNRVLDGFLPPETSVTDRLGSTEANHVAYQEYRRFPPEAYEEAKDAIKFWWGIMPGHTAYPWIFPNRDRVCRVGLTMPIGLDLDEIEDRAEYALLRPDDDRIPPGRVYIRRLLEREYGDEYDVDEAFPVVEDRGKSGGTETYAISSTRPVDSPARAGIAVAGGAMGTTSAFHEGGDHLAVRTGWVAGKLAALGDMTDYNRYWKKYVGEEVLRNVAMAEMARDYGPDDWDEVVRTANRMLADADSEEVGPPQLFERKFTAGWEATKLVASYRLQKFRFRDGRYVQLTEDEYVY